MFIKEKIIKILKNIVINCQLACIYFRKNLQGFYVTFENTVCKESEDGVTAMDFCSGCDTQSDKLKKKVY